MRGTRMPVTSAAREFLDEARLAGVGCELLQASADEVCRVDVVSAWMPGRKGSYAVTGRESMRADGTWTASVLAVTPTPSLTVTGHMSPRQAAEMVRDGERPKADPAACCIVMGSDVTDWSDRRV